ncbi:hypothetical protein LAU_0055 [Lausannevirus]|uniref:Uncharacterized protein n=2 Tax=Lausannevirus TaxID=999883 RepID=A0A0N9P6G8_9VIRU|nr:hypothetical protein LAU_0055 [Lausannevirus]AEA06911.1 hypothetical protein LAU_0055 [Lausannevirus]ALH06749.1 hypothetical protein PMV_051 [Port-miou virus]
MQSKNSEQLDIVRLEYELCEKKEKRLELLRVLDELHKENFGPFWIGRFVTRGGNRIYKVLDVGEEKSLFERLEFLFDPCGWKETREIFTLPNKSVWRLLSPKEIVSGKIIE